MSKSALRSSFGVFSVLGLVLPLLGTPAPAAAADTDLVTIMTAAKIEGIMNSFSDVKNFKEAGNNVYSFETAGFKIFLQNGGETMLVTATFDGAATLTRLNEWNRSKWFTKAYLDKSNNVCLEHSLELNGGVTEKNVKEWMGTFVLCLKEFKKLLEE